MCYLTSGAVSWMLQLHFRAEVVTLFYGPLYDILRHSTCRLFLKMYAEYPDVFSMPDECRLQFLFTDKVCHQAQFVLNAY